MLTLEKINEKLDEMKVQKVSEVSWVEPTYAAENPLNNGITGGNLTPAHWYKLKEVSATYAKLMILNVETHVYETIMVLDKRYRIVQRKCVD